MEDLHIETIFTDEDKKFNRLMVNNTRNLKDSTTSSFQNQEYDFISKILNDFNKKWEILAKERKEWINNNMIKK